jgi:glycosyltransferase involved in cell wall biosynthesis
MYHIRFLLYIFLKRSKRLKDLTVIIPVYNNMNIINNLIQKISFLSQYYNQIIIIDDCSTDSTYLELHECININNLRNVELIKNDNNKGPSFSRNLGIKKSTSEYIAFLDSDDDWHPQKIEIQIKMMKKYDVLICGSVHKVISESELKYEKLIDYGSSKNIIISYVSWPKILFISPFATPSVVIHKSIKNYLFDENIRYSEDYNLWKRITYKNKAIKIQLPLTYTFKHDYISQGDSLSSNLKKMQMGVEQSFQKLLESDEISFVDKGLVVVALIFSKIKYIRRVFRNLIKRRIS